MFYPIPVRAGGYMDATIAALLARDMSPSRAAEEAAEITFAAEKRYRELVKEEQEREEKEREERREREELERKKETEKRFEDNARQIIATANISSVEWAILEAREFEKWRRIPQRGKRLAEVGLICKPGSGSYVRLTTAGVWALKIRQDEMTLPNP